MSVEGRAPGTGFEPLRPAFLASVVFLVAGLTLFWPILTGHFFAFPASDSYVAGYGFRDFAAHHFRDYGEIPLWNPYLFGGLPFVGAMHGDVFYPTAWLRWVLPTFTAMNLGFALHLVLAGCAMYAFLRALRVGWVAAVTGGLAYELTGIVASLVHPGHDGKLFVSALTPFVFLAILRAVRDRRGYAYGLLAFGVGLALHGHPQLSYYLLVAAALWGAWLTFLAPDHPTGARRLRILAGAVVAVLVGFGLYAIQALPFIEYIPYSPRAAGGPSGGWEYATAYSLPLEELTSLVLPEFSGLGEGYWGRNFLKHHTEYVGVLPLLLAVLGAGDRSRRPVLLALGAIGLFFFLLALGGHSPFYRLWYEVMPLMKKVRAPGMAFFLTAFPLAAFAGFGVDRLLRGEVPVRRIGILAAILAGVGVLALSGILQAVAESVALRQRIGEAVANAATLRGGGLRVLLLALLAGGLLGAMAAGRLPQLAGAALLFLLTVGDLWSVERRFFVFQPIDELYQEDEVIAAIKRTPAPFRILDLGFYNTSSLMAHRIPQLLGYHGNELRFFDELLGGKGVWDQATHPTIWRLYTVGHIVWHQDVSLPGYRKVVGPVPSPVGVPVFLYQVDEPLPWATVIPAAVKVPEDQIVPTLLDPRFPVEQVVLYSDTAAVSPAPLPDSGLGTASPSPATVVEWRAGRLLIRLDRPTEAPAYLLVAENWYPDWRARVDGTEVPTLRGDYALLSVALPTGAREVELVFRSRAYTRGKVITLVAVLAALALLVVPEVAGRRTPAGGSSRD